MEPQVLKIRHGSFEVSIRNIRRFIVDGYRPISGFKISCLDGQNLIHGEGFCQSSGIKRTTVYSILRFPYSIPMKKAASSETALLYLRCDFTAARHRRATAKNRR